MKQNRPFPEVPDGRVISCQTNNTAEFRSGGSSRTSVGLLVWQNITRCFKNPGVRAGLNTEQPDDDHDESTYRHSVIRDEHKSIDGC
jgi:hypothetical protein